MDTAEGSSAPLGLTWTEGLLHQLGRWRWRIDAAVERLSKAVEIRSESPKDYDDSDERSREVLNLLHQLIRRPAGGNYYEGNQPPHNGNGDRRTLNWILGVVSLLLVGAVGGSVGMYGKLTAIERGLNDHNARIERLERASERQ